MKEENGHHHNHGHDHEKDYTGFNPKQLKTLIAYLIKHNLNHIEDLKKWHKQSIESGFNDIATEFRKIIRLSEKIDRRLMSTLGKIEKR